MSLIIAVEPPLAPTTTHQEDITTASQRRISLIWETTQAVVTVLITIAALYCAINDIKSDVLNYAFIAVLSSYYARTNHTRVGGSSTGKYEGR